MCVYMLGVFASSVIAILPIDRIAKGQRFTLALGCVAQIFAALLLRVGACDKTFFSSSAPVQTQKGNLFTTATYDSTRIPSSLSPLPWMEFYKG